MNKDLEIVSGNVEAVGTKFNGSVLVNGQWLNFKKGTDYSTIVRGERYQFSLEEWEFKGKTGKSVISFELLQVPQKSTPIKLLNISKGADLGTECKPRDFDAENRGKVRHGLMVALVPLIATSTIDKEEAKELVNELTSFVMEGK